MQKEQSSHEAELTEERRECEGGKQSGILAERRRPLDGSAVLKRIFPKDYLVKAFHCPMTSC
jgi:hypothetical protein